MSFRGLAAAALIGSVALTAEAQIEDSGLDLVNPWGMSFLEAGEPSLSTDMWSASDADDLLPLMRDVRTHGLTPAERTLMRRMALSPAAPPPGAQEPALRAERARIMYELGEAEAAASLMARLETPPPGLDADEIVADLNLALGNEATACNMLDDPDRMTGYWAKLRAVCAALRGNTAGAELAIEMALQQDAVDSWLLSAVFAASGELPEPPEADFSSGLNLAISAEAGLVPPDSPIPDSRPDLAAAMAEHPNLPDRLRVEAAAQAAAAGLLPDRTYRSLFLTLVNSPDFVPETALESAVYAARDPLVSDENRAFALASALEESMRTPAEFRVVSALLWEEIARLPVTAATAPGAPVFARAALATGHFRAAKDWSSANTMEGALADGAFDAARMAALVVLAGQETSASAVSYIGTRLAEQAESETQLAEAKRLFSLWTALGIAAPAEARRLMSEGTAEAGDQAFQPALLAILAAAEANAAGEVILSTVGLTHGDPSELDDGSLLILLKALQRIGAEDGARQLALEASGYWKAS